MTVVALGCENGVSLISSTNVRLKNSALLSRLRRGEEEERASSVDKGQVQGVLGSEGAGIRVVRVVAELGILAALLRAAAADVRVLFRGGDEVGGRSLMGVGVGEGGVEDFGAGGGGE
ncbi:MAG: hypothetical protein M1821_007032 [Bathelium mastoideum]|nr:MAG: hypothetical protein M1821_007032 [Bathelium mastoideum]